MKKSDNQTRRGALLGLGAGALLAACKKKWRPAAEDEFGLARAKPHVPGAERFSTHEERWANTTCDQCPAGCGVRIRVVEGRAVRVEGNPDSPLNRGKVGPRGLAGLQVLYDPDRLDGPRARSSGDLFAVGWSEALERATAALAKASGEDVLVVSGRERGMINQLLRRFCAGLGGASFLDGSHSHSAPIKQAMSLTLGVEDVPTYDWGGARTVLTLESGLLGDSCQGVYFSRLAAERRGRERPTVIHAGSGFDLSAHAADRWLRVEPGTSGALALGLAHALLEAGTFDAASISRAADLADFDNLVARFNPARTAEVTGLEPTAIGELATTLWREQPSFVVVDDRTVGFDNGVDTARAALALNLVLGAVEASAGGVRAPSPAPLRQWPPVGGAIKELADAGEVLSILEGSKKPKVVMLYQANPVFARSQPQRWRRALAAIDTVISFSPFLDETCAEVADIVLPDHTFLERREDAGAAPAISRAVVGVRQPVVAPLHDTRASGDVVIELAQRLGGQVAAALPWRRFSDAVEAQLLGLHDADRGTVRAPSEHAFLSQLYRAGLWSEQAAPPPRPIEARLPGRWQQPAWIGEATQFPLRMIVYRPLGTTAGGGGANLPWLQQLKGLPGDRPWRRVARVHPASAPGLEDGDEVEITSPVGSIRMPIALDQSLVSGVITVPLGGGHTAFGRFAKDRGANANELLASDKLCATRVSIRRVS